MEHAPAEILWERLFGLRPKDELVALVYQQLSSDFQRAGCPLAFEETLDPLLWSNALFKFLQQQPSHAIQQLYYVIDLPETLIMTIQTADDYMRHLADAIIYRELVKIYYKISYSA